MRKLAAKFVETHGSVELYGFYGSTPASLSILYLVWFLIVHSLLG